MGTRVCFMQTSLSFFAGWAVHAANTWVSGHVHEAGAWQAMPIMWHDLCRQWTADGTPEGCGKMPAQGSAV